MELQTALPLFVEQPPVTFRSQAVEALVAFRQEWQQLVDGESLMNVQAPVGLLLADIADKLGFTPQEQHVFLGQVLLEEVNLFLQDRIEAANQH